MSEIKFACPNCRQHIACDDGYASMSIECPSCGSSMQIPAALERPLRSPPRESWITVSRSKSETGSFLLSISKIFSVLSLGSSRTRLPDFSDFGDGIITIRPYWLLFWSVLLAPAIVSLIALSVSKSETVWMSIVSVGSVLAGIICGLMLARSKESVAGKILIFIICSPVLALLSFGFCVVGCTVIGLGIMSKH